MSDLLSRRDFIQTGIVLAGATAISVSAKSDENGSRPVFEAGVGIQDITPDPGVRMWGYSDRGGPATGTLDPLFARAIALRTADATVVIATMDLGRVPRSTVLNRIRERAKSLNVDHIIFTASHTHGGPILESDDEPHIQRIEQGLDQAISDAVQSLVPASVGTSTATFDVSHNRRKILPDGRCAMMWRNAERLPTSPVDHEATIIRIDKLDGTPIATLVHYACHPVTLGPDNRQFTADWVGEMTRQVKASTGSECLFLQGGAGDINPYLDKTPLEEGGLDALRETGRICANAAIEAWKSIKVNPPANPRLSYHEEMVEVGTRWDFSDPKQIDVFRAIYGPAFDGYLSFLKSDLAIPLSALLINDDLALTCMPGELFVQYQLDLKSRSLGPRTLLVGYANDFHIYFPTIRDAAAGGYGGISATYVGLGAGEKLVARAQIAIGGMTGKLRPFCSPEDFQLLEYNAGNG